MLPFFKCMLGCCGKTRHIYCTTSALSDTLHTYIHTHFLDMATNYRKKQMKHIWTFTHFRIDLCICYVLLQRSHVVSFGLWCWGTNSCVWTKKFYKATPNLNIVMTVSALDTLPTGPRYTYHCSCMSQRPSGQCTGTRSGADTIRVAYADSWPSDDGRRGATGCWF